MTYVEYMRRVRDLAVSRAWPWLCCVAEDVAAGAGDDYTAAKHSSRLLRTIRSQLLGETYLPTALRAQRPDWPYADAGGKAIRIAWLDEQIKLAEAEAGACTPT